MENSANIENQVMQDSGGRKPKEGKGATPSKRPVPQWCPRGITKTQKCRLQKMHQRELDCWFNCLRPMTKPKQTWQEKWLAKEEGGTSGDSSGEEVSKVTSARGEDKTGSGAKNPESGDCHLESGNRNPDSGKSNPGKENDRQGEEPVLMDVNMLFMTLIGLHVECATFKKLENSGAHMKPLFIRGHLDGMPIGHMLIDGGASVSILPLSLFKKLIHIEGDLKRTNLSHSSFGGEPMEAKGIICKELTIGSKTMPTTFFMVDVKGCYNVLLKWDWIHANECVPSTLHQCAIQWISDEVEVVQVNEEVCVVVAESQVDILGRKMDCLSSKDLMGYDYICVGQDGFVSISVKPMIGATRLAHDL
jgi:hypothetical protein